MEKCFAMKKSGCSILLVAQCPGYDKCSFYKSEQQLKEDQAACNAHLNTLPPEQQRYIADTYYNKKMPWANEAE